MEESAPERATFRNVFAVGEFRALWVAQILSVLGDQLARVALSMLVFNRTGSALLTAATYAVTYLPWVFGALFLSGLGDRFPRRQVMVVSDVARAGLVGVMTVPGMPLWTLIALLFGITLLEAPFAAARAATIADILSGDQYVVGTAIARTTNQIAFVTGFATGGATVALLGVRPSLAVDAATFLVSALVIGSWVHARSASTAHSRPSSPLADSTAAIRLVFGDARLRTLVLFAWLAAFYVVPEGLAVPYAAKLGGGAMTAGVLLAAMPFGAALGAVAYSRLVDAARRLRWMGLLALGTCAVLVLMLPQPGLAVASIILAVSGVFSSYQLAANAAFVRAIPDEQRSQAFGLVQAGFSISQSGSIVLAGWAAEAVGPAKVIGASGVMGALAAGALATSWRRTPVEASA